LCCDRSERLTLTLKRRVKLGPYEPADIAVLDSLLPELHAAVRIARRVLDAEASGVVQVLQQRGDSVFELDVQARVLRVHGNDAERSGLFVRNGRLVAVDRLAQPPLDRAIAAALTPPQRPTWSAVADRRGKRAFVHVVPVTGGARDVFLATAAVAVVIEPSPQAAPDGLLPDGIREALGLTIREAQIARLLAEGLSLTEIAVRLRMRIGTARNHLKSIFDKSGARRQGEVVALLSKLKS
jgi:DNA-binding CsgD family transcriptional regulator